MLPAKDEDGVRHVALETLERSGYRGFEAGKPEEALRRARQHAGAIHLLLTDVVMPRMNGRVLADRLVALRQELKVLFTSSYTADAVGHHGALGEGEDRDHWPRHRNGLTGP